jgi:hypothetical protein
MIANGSATRPERNIGKKFIGVFLLEPAPASLIQCYADYNDNAGSNDTMTFTMYAGWKGKGMQFGLQGFYQQRKLSGNATNISGASLSATVSLNDSMNIVTRVDRLFSTNPSGDKISFLPLVNDSKYTYVLLAFDWKISNELRISPNAEMVFYDIKYKPDYFLRLTFYTAMN